MIDGLIKKWETEIRRGAIQLLVCAVLSEQDLHGKGICNTIAGKTDELIKVPLGTVYPLLRRYIKEELVETYKPKEDQRKTIYTLNANGREFYMQMREMWLRYSAAVNRVIDDIN